MHRRFLVLCLLLPVAAIFAADSQTQFKYPAAPTSDQVDDYSGTKVADPYRPLENPDAPESRKWIEAENKITFDFLKTIPERDGIKSRLTEVWDYERFGVPFKEKKPLLLFQEQRLAKSERCLYHGQFFREAARAARSKTRSPKMGRSRWAGMDVTDDAKLMAYGLATAGSDWQQWKVREVETGKDRPDLLDWIKFSNTSWKKDGADFSTAATTSRTRKTNCARRFTITNSSSTSSEHRNRRIN